MKRVLGGVIALATSIALWSCGERPQEMGPPVHGKYQGKPDEQPWNNAKWNNNESEWEKALKARNQNQNEYTRVN